MSDKLQIQRFELKYIIDEPVALAIRDYVSTQLELDEFSVGKPGFPQWLADMVRAFNLRPCSAAKYVDRIRRMSDVWGGGHSSEFVSKRLLGEAAVSKTNGAQLSPLRKLERTFESGAFARLQSAT